MTVFILLLLIQCCVNGNENIRINNIDVNIISNINIIIINSNKVIVNNASNITNSIGSNSIMDLTNDKTVNSTHDNHNIIYIGMVIHHVNDISINDNININTNNSIIASNGVKN